MLSGFKYLLGYGTSSIMFFSFSVFVRVLLLSALLLSSLPFSMAKESTGSCKGSLSVEMPISIVPPKNGPLNKSANDLKSLTPEEALSYLTENSLAARLIVLDVLYSKFFEIMILRATDGQISNFELKSMDRESRKNLSVKIDSEIREAFSTGDSSLANLSQPGTARLLYENIKAREARLILMESLVVIGSRIDTEDLQQEPGEINVVNVKKQMSDSKLAGVPDLLSTVAAAVLFGGEFFSEMSAVISVEIFSRQKKAPVEVLSNYALSHSQRLKPNQLPEELEFSKYHPKTSLEELSQVAAEVRRIHEKPLDPQKSFELLDQGLRVIKLHSKLNYLFHDDIMDWVETFDDKNPTVLSHLQEIQSFQSMNEQSLDLIAEVFESLAEIEEVANLIFELNSEVRKISKDILKKVTPQSLSKLSVSEEVEAYELRLKIDRSTLTQKILHDKIATTQAVLLGALQNLTRVPKDNAAARGHRIEELTEEFLSKDLGH